MRDRSRAAPYISCPVGEGHATGVGQAACLGMAPSKRLRNVCEIERNKLKNAGYLFLWLHRRQLPSGGILQANYLRTWPVSSNEASPLCSSAPRSVRRGAVCRANPSGLHEGSTHSAPPKTVWAAPTTTPSRGMVTGTSQSPGI